MPDYAVRLVDDVIEFQNRDAQSHTLAGVTDCPVLDPETYQQAKLAAPGFDIYYLEQEWQNWWFESGKPEMRSPDRAFVGFCRKRYERESPQT